MQIAWSEMEVAREKIEHVGVEFGAWGFKPAKHIMEELESLIAMDCTKIHNWRSIRVLLNRFHDMVQDFPRRQRILGLHVCKRRGLV